MSLSSPFRRKAGTFSGEFSAADDEALSLSPITDASLSISAYETARRRELAENSRERRLKALQQRETLREQTEQILESNLQKLQLQEQQARKDESEFIRLRQQEVTLTLTALTERHKKEAAAATEAQTRVQTEVARRQAEVQKKIDAEKAAAAKLEAEKKAKEEAEKAAAAKKLAEEKAKQAAAQQATPAPVVTQPGITPTTNPVGTMQTNPLAPQPTATTATAPSVSTGPVASSHGLPSTHAPPAAVDAWVQRREAYDRLRSAAASVSMDPNVKELQKRINIAVNQIANTPEKVRATFQRIKELLDSAGRPEYAAAGVIKACDAIVAQGEEQLAVHKESAYACATVAAAVAGHVGSLFNDAFLYTLHEKCPYTIPIYFPTDKTLTTEQNLERVGKRPGDTEEQFHTRMSGYIRLYAAYTIAKLPQHPHGIDYAWKWMARMLNMTSRKVTGPCVLAFLEVAGGTMLRTYPNQFPKILKLIHTHGLKQMEEKGVSKAVLTNIRSLLDEYSRTRRLPEPESARLL